MAIQMTLGIAFARSWLSCLGQLVSVGFHRFDGHFSSEETKCF